MGLQQKYLDCKRHLQEIVVVTNYNIKELGKVNDTSLYSDLLLVKNLITEIENTIFPLQDERIKRFEPQEEVE